MAEKKGVSPINKAFLSLAIALVLLVAPSLKLLESYRFSQNAVVVEAEITSYDPEVQGMAGGRRQIRDFYTIRYLGVEKRLQLGSRVVGSMEKVEPPEKDAPFAPGDSLAIYCLPESPEKMLIKREGGLFMAAYHAGNMAPLLYLLKLAAVVLLLVSVRQFFLWVNLPMGKVE